MGKERVLWVSALLFVSILFSVSCLADGGGPELPNGACNNIPNPNYDGPLITGTFIAAPDQSQWVIDDPNERHYNIHIILKGTKLVNGEEIPVVKLYSIAENISIDPQKPDKAPNLCEYPLWYLKEKFRYYACNRDVAGTFGFPQDQYYPVLTQIWVNRKDNCSDNQEAMISGTFKIRISPWQVNQGNP